MEIRRKYGREILYIHFQKAFDAAQHNRLICKQYKNGTIGNNLITLLLHCPIWKNVL